jgi:hypothetical protein
MWLASATTLILAALETEIRRISIQGQPRQKVDWAWWCVPVIPNFTGG